MKLSSRLTFLTDVMVVSLAAACFTSPAVAVVIEAQSANTEVILDATGAGLIMEDPPVGTMYFECTVIEWRDADNVVVSSSAQSCCIFVIGNDAVSTRSGVHSERVPWVLSP